jgi:diguanylate cyclase (GGDEF)-like protein
MPSDTLAMLARLGTMFERTTSVRDDIDLQQVLEEVARAISEVLSYRAVVINIYRPAFDDMLTAAAIGPDDNVRSLIGTISPTHTWLPLLTERFRRRDGAYFVPDGDFDWDALGVDTYVPDLEPPDHPDAWLPGDALFAPLHDQSKQLIGVISVDEPESGMRPTDQELDVLVTIARHAALAMRIGQDITNDMEHQRMLERVLEVSARLAAASDTDAVLQAVADGIQDALGFQKVLIGTSDEIDRPLVTRAAAGWPPEAAALDHGASLKALDGLMCEDFEVAGCYLLPADVAEDRLGIEDFPYRSELNGRGPHAWARHWLLVPLEEGGRRIGVIWVDDPRDRLLPSRARLQALRLFANQAVAAVHNAKQADRLRHEATHDALTGLPNRRAFRGRMAREIDSRARFALVLCDMDNLKHLNDTRGHDAGDKALQQLAAALRSELRHSDSAYRIGGDEFAVVLAGAGWEEADQVLARLGEAVALQVPSGGQPLEASFGVAVYEPGDDPERVIGRADKALYDAKRRRETVA